MKINKFGFIFSTFQMLVSLILISLMTTKVISDVSCGVVLLLFVFLEIYFSFKNNNIFSPLTPCYLVEFTFSLYTFKLVNSYEDLPFAAMIIICLCMYIWKIITYMNPNFTQKKINFHIKEAVYSRNSFTLTVTILFLISTLAMLFEWYKAGGIPILRSDLETFRFTTSYSSITHLLAIMNKIVAISIGVFFINKGSIHIRKDFILILEIISAELLMIGTAMRGEMILAPCVIFAFYAVKHKIPIKIYIVAGVLALLFIGVFPYFRSMQMYGASYAISIQRISTYPDYYMFTPLYESLTNSFKILNWDLNIFPDKMAFGFGSYAILPQIPLLDLGSSLSDIQNQFFNEGFYATLTGTMFSYWYADFGYAGFFIVTILYGCIVNYAYKLLFKRQDMFSFIWYSYTFYTALWMFYSCTFDQVYLIYSFILFLIMKTRIRQH